MILTEFKPVEEILKNWAQKKIFILGCGGCPEGAEIWGKKVLNEMKDTLEQKGLEITGLIEIDFYAKSL